MNITKECVECIVGQIEKATKLLELDDKLASTINEETKAKALNFDFEKTPPHVAKDVYEFLALKTKLKDPLEKLKQESIKKATSYLPFVEEKIFNSKEKLFTAIKTAVAGNVIDFATTKEFCLDKEINTIFETNFAINHYDDFKSELEKTHSLIVLADNAGENVFDKILIKTIHNLYPKVKIYYATRGKAIINDITTKEALESGIDKYCEVRQS